MEMSQLLRQSLISLRGRRVGTRWNPRLEEVASIPAHLMKVSYIVRLPFMEQGDSTSGFWVSEEQEITIKIGEIVVGSAIGPILPVLLMVAITDIGLTAVVIGPG